MDSNALLAGENKVGHNPGCDTEETAHVLLPYLSHNWPHREPSRVKGMPFRSHTSFSAHTFDSSLSNTSDEELERVRLAVRKRVVKLHSDVVSRHYYKTMD